MRVEEEQARPDGYTATLHDRSPLGTLSSYLIASNLSVSVPETEGLDPGAIVSQESGDGNEPSAVPEGFVDGGVHVELR